MKRISKCVALMLAIIFLLSPSPASVFASQNSSSLSATIKTKAEERASQPEKPLSQSEVTQDEWGKEAQNTESTSNGGVSELPPEGLSPPVEQPQEPPTEENTETGNDSEDKKQPTEQGTEQTLPEVSKPTEEKEFVPLNISEVWQSTDVKIGDEVKLFIKLNRDDVIISYQWQKKELPKELTVEEHEASLTEMLAGDENEKYFFPVEEMTEQELLALNPDAEWNGKELYDEKVAAGDAAAHIENGTPVTAETEKPTVLAAPEEWSSIDGQMASEYIHTVSEDDARTYYRCVITINDEKYIADATEAAIRAIKENGIVDEGGKTVKPENPAEYANIVKELTSNDMHIEILQKQSPLKRSASMFALSSAPLVGLSGSWISGVDRTMEYITAEGYDRLGASAANNPNWTRLGGGTRADGTPYLAAVVTGNNKTPVSSVWYGKTVYFRFTGSSGQGTAIEIPAYTNIDYVTGKKSLYKNSVSVLCIRVPETGMDFYAEYINAMRNQVTYELHNGKENAICTTRVPLTPNGMQYKGRSFNENSKAYLTDAEGNYRYDSVLMGVCVGAEPDLSGAAACSLKDYINEGYGFMTGHDTMYGYGGVTARSYKPDPTDTTTPYYWINTNIDGHWNMNWLMGVNDMYTNASPYEAASMVLCCGDWRDKSSLYGDGDTTKFKSVMRIKKTVPGNADADVSLRTPTNYPYDTLLNPSTGATMPIAEGVEFISNATHTNQQMAYGTIWLDFASNSIETSGFGRLMTDSRNGGKLVGTNNFYLTTNGNYAFNQIGHVVTGQAAQYPELQIFANTVMYISQRQQCQVCQSEQGGNKDVHFVHRISSVEELEKIKNQTENWFTYPDDGCYMLDRNITLPEDWTPIKNFHGHFHADNYGAVNGNLTNKRVKLNSKNTPLFANTGGTLDQYSSMTTPGAACNTNGVPNPAWAGKVGWNLGTDSTVGTNNLFNASGVRTTGMARVSGYLAELLGGVNADWANHMVVVKGSDGNDYYCKTNIDGKYVIANLPCTGEMKAFVYKVGAYDGIDASNGIKENGNIYVNVLPDFWDADDTTNLYMKGYKASPLSDDEVYEGETAHIIKGGVIYPIEVKNITWEFKKPNSEDWLPISQCDYEYMLLPPVFHPKKEGKEAWTEVGLEIKNTILSQSDSNFRAIFKADGGETADTYSVRSLGFNGHLIVKPHPMYITDPMPQAVWVDNTATYVSTCDFRADIKSDKGFSLIWQYRNDPDADWENINLSDVKYKITNTVAEGTIDPARAARKTITTLTVFPCESKWTNYSFRVLYAAGASHAETHAAQLTVKRPTLTVSPALDQKLWLDNDGMSIGTATYTSRITYMPGMTDAKTPDVAVKWMYSGGKDKYESFEQKVWNQTAANSQAVLLGVEGNKAPTVKVETSAPVINSDGSRTLISTMTISNAHALFDSGNTRYYFSCTATSQYTNEYITTIADTRAALQLDYNCDIKYNEGKSELGLSDEVGTYGQWTFPQLEVFAGRDIHTLILRFDGQYNENDTMRVTGALPGDMVRAINAGHYLMLTSVKGISANDLQEYLRKNLIYKSYDERLKPATIFAYIDCAVNMAPRSAGSRGMVRAAAPLVSENVTITRHPSGVTLKQGQNASYSITAASNTGSLISYQWQISDNGGRTWSDIDGETSSTYTVFKAMNLQNGWYFRCKAWTANSAVMTSTAAALKITSDVTVVPTQDDYRWVGSSNNGGITTSGSVVAVSAQGYANWNAYGQIVLKHSDGSNVNPYDYSHIRYSYQCTSFSSEGGVSGLGDGNISMSYNNSWNDRIFDWGGTRDVAPGAFSSGAIYFKVQPFSTAFWCAATYQITGMTLYSGNAGTDEDANISRSDKSAMDTTQIYREKIKPIDIGAAIDAQDKVYDGTEQNAVVTLTPPVGIDKTVLDGILDRATIKYSNGGTTSGNESGSGCIDSGSYTATVTFNESDVESFGLDGELTVKFKITKRPLTLESLNNDKTYDGKHTALIKDIEMELFNAAAKRGIIPQDVGNVSLTTTAADGKYPDRNQSNGVQTDIKRTSRIDLEGTRAFNYYIESERYTGAIVPRELFVHSRYLDEPDKPRNIRLYTGTTGAIIADIIVDNICANDDVRVSADKLDGVYVTAQSGETLNADGTVLEDRYLHLKENAIVRSSPIALINNDKGNYVIGEEAYSGAIYRCPIEVRVVDYQIEYGSNAALEPKTALAYTNADSGQGSNLLISAFIPGDALVIDSTKSHFVLPDNMPTKAPVGSYPITYEGLNEGIYDVLKNYVVLQIPGQVIVTPLTLTVTVDGGYSKLHGDVNPPFTATIKGFAEGDNFENSLTGTTQFSTLSNAAAPIRYGDDGTTPKPYEVAAYGLSCKPNANGLENYKIEYISGDITILPRPIVPQVPPQTGDNSNWQLWLILAMVSAPSIVILWRMWFKKRKE